jgi:hypothetical protein
VIGLCDEDPAWLMRLADLVMGFKQISEECHAREEDR